MKYAYTTHDTPKKQIVVEAVQWTGDGLSEAVDWLPEPDGLLDITTFDTSRSGDKMFLSMNGHVEVVDPGYWIVKADTLMVCSDKLFQQHYKPVD